MLQANRSLNQVEQPQRQTSCVLNAASITKICCLAIPNLNFFVDVMRVITVVTSVGVVCRKSLYNLCIRIRSRSHINTVASAGIKAFQLFSLAIIKGVRVHEALVDTNSELSMLCYLR